MGMGMKVIGEKFGRVHHEFYCHCGIYVAVKLRHDLNGAHCFVCPRCGHEHYRVVRYGVITEDRAPESMRDRGCMNVIKAPESACHSKPWEARERARLEERERQRDPQGFLSDLWKRFVCDN